MDQLFKTKTGKVVLSVIWGIGIAALFYMATKNGGLMVVKAPNAEEVQSNVYQFEKDCYTFSPYPAKCASDAIETFEGCNPDLVPVVPLSPKSKPPMCENRSNFEHPMCIAYAQRSQMNCGDPRHYKEPGCYRHHPMDSIFRSPSNQIYYPYTRN